MLIYVNTTDRQTYQNYCSEPRTNNIILFFCDQDQR